jgi:hypothetical protein
LTAASRFLKAAAAVRSWTAAGCSNQEADTGGDLGRNAGGAAVTRGHHPHHHEQGRTDGNQSVGAYSRQPLPQLPFETDVYEANLPWVKPWLPDSSLQHFSQFSGNIKYSASLTR